MSDADRTRELLQISCADALELMTEYLEEALSPADAARMRAHLAGCQGCWVFLDQLRAIIVLARDHEPAEEYRIEPDRLEALVELFRHERHT